MSAMKGPGSARDHPPAAAPSAKTNLPDNHQIEVVDLLKDPATRFERIKAWTSSDVDQAVARSRSPRIIGDDLPAGSHGSQKCCFALGLQAKEPQVRDKAMKSAIANY